MTNDFKDELFSAQLGMKSVSLDLMSLLPSLRRMDHEEAAKEFPHELLAAYSALCEARSAILHLLQSQREAIHARYG